MEVAPDGTRVAITVGGEAVEVAAVWLRGACHCPACRRPATNERLFDPTAIDPGVRVVGAVEATDRIQLSMSDGHVVALPVEQLGLVRSVVARTAIPHRSTGTVHPTAEVQRFSCDDLSAVLRELLDQLAADGVVLVDGVDPSEDGLRSVAELIAPIQPTNYGTLWSIDAVIDPVSEVESSHALLVHTDLPYRHDPPGAQLLLACQVDVAGGASTLVDGYAAAEHLRREERDAFELLAHVPVEYPYVRDDVEIIGRSPLIELDHDGSVRVIRRAPDLMGSAAVTAEDAADFHRALCRWWRLLDDPDRAITVPLAPGELLIFDNHRMLHGRTAFELGAEGRRVLRGCYLHRDDVASRRAVLARPEL